MVCGLLYHNLYEDYLINSVISERCPVRLQTAPTGAWGTYRITELFSETSFRL